MNQKDSMEAGGYIKPLTGIRAIAAFMVFMMHYNPFEKDSFLYSFFGQFYTGVSVFFVLSGFLITYRYYERFRMEKRWFYRYIRNRVARIYPVYFLLTTITAIYFLAGELGKHGAYSNRQIIVNSGWVYFTNITFIRGYLHDLLFSLIPQGWSLSVEEFFYFSAPITWLLIKKRFNLVLQAIALLAAGWLLIRIGAHVHFYGFFDTPVFMLKFTYFGKAIQFFAGVVLAMWLVKQKGGGRPGTPGKSATSGSWVTYGGLLLMIGCIVSLAIAWRYGQTYVCIVIDNVLLSFAIALFFRGLITEKSLVATFLSSPLMDLLGKSSYAFYLIHVGICQHLLNQYVTHNLLVQFILLNLISIAVYKWIEHPLMVLIKGKPAAKTPVRETPMPNESFAG
jgi:peptidoglycan/LPS O-acetylase OafA/YrhL